MKQTSFFMSTFLLLTSLVGYSGSPFSSLSTFHVQLHSEHHEVVADLHQTSFLFSIPIDGPMSFSTSKVTVQWSLRFEFFTTPEGTDPARYASVLTILCAGTVSCFHIFAIILHEYFDRSS